MYNSRSIFQFADALNARASMIVITYTVLSALVGAFLGYQYGDSGFTRQGEVWAVGGLIRAVQF